MSLFLPAGGIVYAGEAPLLQNPANTSTTNSTKLEWQQPSYSLYSSNPFRVQVDDASDLSSPDKDYYTANVSYTPTLVAGLWYWRVRARDNTGTWSDWSNIWSFTYSQSTPTPSPTSTPTPTPSSSNTPQPSSSSFQISQTPSKVDSNQSFSVNISITGLTPNAKYFIKGAFFKSGSTNYFGKTKVGSDWIKNSSTYSSQYSFTTDSNGNPNLSLEVMPDESDSGFSSSGNYLFKVGRYNSSGSGPTWSNEVEIAINKSSSATTTSGSTANLSSPSPTTKSSTSQTKTTSTETADKKIDYQIPDIKGVATEVASLTDEIPTKPSGKINWFFIVGAILVLLSGGFLIYKNYPNIVKKGGIS